MSPWIKVSKYPYSAAEAFLKSLSLSDVHVRTRNRQWTTEGSTVPEITPAEAENPSSLASAFGKWAKRFRIGYDYWTVVYSFDDGIGTRQAWMKIPIDWDKWVDVLFGDYMEMGHELFYQTYLADGSHPEIEELPWHVEFKGGELVFKNYEGGEMFKKTPKEFVEDVVEATQKRWDAAFKNWVFILRLKSGLIKTLDNYNELESLLAKKEGMEAQYYLIRKGNMEPDSQQIEVKADLPDREAVYGVAKDIPENTYFLKACLGFEKEINDCRHCTFDLPLPLLNSFIY